MACFFFFFFLLPAVWLQTRPCPALAQGAARALVWHPEDVCGFIANFCTRSVIFKLLILVVSLKNNLAKTILSRICCVLDFSYPTIIKKSDKLCKTKEAILGMTSLLKCLTLVTGCVWPPHGCEELRGDPN